MTIPNSSLYPDAFDTDNELFLVHDSLRVKLLEDYAPGDTTIYVQGDITRFPPTGLITLTDQCNDPANRALTFFYNSKTETTFDGLELLPEFTDIAKPKRLTNVTMNVTADTHNSIKDALIAIQDFCGIKGTVDARPLGTTLEGRINFLRQLVLRPRAWFSVSQRVGIIPFKVIFTDLSFRNPSYYFWDFGDGNTSTISFISSDAISTDSRVVSYTYYNPGIFDVTLKVTNDFGSDTIVFTGLINARTRAPDSATISLEENSFQLIESIDPDEDPFLYSHLIPGILKSRINTEIGLSILDKGEQIGDPIKTYTWKLGDDLIHGDSPTTKASYSVGGIYDIKVRLDTNFGSYRTTILKSALDIVETTNLFMLVFDPLSVEGAATQNVSAYEYGLVSETFKTNRTSLAVTRNPAFISDSAPNYAQQKREFLRNNGFASRTNVSSGNNGSALAYWAEGGGSGSSLSSQAIRVTEYEGFSDTWLTPTDFVINRPWNWLSLNAPNAVYFLFGADPAGGASTNANRTMLEKLGLTTSSVTLTAANFKNGAEELLTNVGAGDGGDFSVTRTVWDNNNGYIARNDGVGTFFRLKSFYRTEGTTSDPLQFIRQLSPIPGSSKLEGQMTSMTQGVYFFNNTGEILVYSPTTSTWLVGGPGAKSPAFRSLQDSTVSGYDSETQTLIATSDEDRRTYLSFDYSPRTFLRFNESDLTFVSLISRPAGEQFCCGVF